MQCQLCTKPAILTQPPLCEHHFTAWVEETVKQTIRTFNLLHKDWVIGIGMSGGKDSTTLAYILTRLGYKVKAIAIDEGIPGYRDQTLEDLKTFTTQHAIPLRIIRVKDVYGTTIHRIAHTHSIIPCRVCGVWRRRLLERAALEEGVDAIATGHNLDDEVQSILMNLVKANIHVLARLTPRTGEKLGEKPFTPRVKPLIMLSEKHIAMYSYLKRFPVHYTECPYHDRGLRHRLRPSLTYEEKKRILLTHLSTTYAVEEKPLTTCRICGLPSSKSICTACRYAQTLGKNHSSTTKTHTHGEEKA